MSKYGNIKVEIDGIKFDSKKEGRRYGELKLLQKANEISHLELHPKFKLEIDGKPILIKSDSYPNGRKATWSGDFAYFCTRRNARIIEDVKGGNATKTQLYKLKRGIVEAMHPHLTIVEI